jgi:serine/threonine-protein kinase
MDWYGRQHAADRLLLALGVVALILAIGLIGPTVLHPPPSVAVPSFEGKSADAARSLASESGLQVALNDESSAGVPAGVVIRQQPSAGDSLRSDRPVHLAVSSGPPPVAMPNILRHDLDSARQELVAAGLALGNVYEYDTNHQAWGTITAQSIRSGRDVPPGSAVDVTIATPPWTTVPRVVDRGIADAEKELTNRGLKLERVNVESQDGVAAGTVLRQEPAPEAQIRQGSGVAIVIAVPGAAEAATR